MVGLLFLAKMIQLNQNRRKLKIKSKENINEEYVSQHYDKLCRICLNRGSIPIFGNANREDLSEIVNLFGVQVHNQDKYPKLLCASCHRFVLNARLFRNTAQWADQLLKRVKNNKETLKYESSNSSDEMPFDDEIYFKDPPKISRISRRTRPKKPNMSKDKGTCDICQKTFTMRYLKRHITFHNIKGTPYMCESCGKKFLMEWQLKKHCRFRCNDLPFECQMCPYRGSSVKNLQSHLKSHTGEKRYLCAHCPFKFVNKSNLNRHMLRHKTEKEFKCTCGKSYHMKKQLDEHFKVDHAGIREHICNLCGKGFGYRKQLMQHQRGVHKRQKLQSGRIPSYLQIESSDCNSLNKPYSVNLQMPTAEGFYQ